MMLAMVDDIRVVLIKLADRLHNMRTLEHLQPERQHKIAEETLEIYAPIAHRLGMGKIRGELEDLGFRYLDPDGYQQVEEAVNARRKQGELFLAKMQGILGDKLKDAGIKPKSRAGSSACTAFTKSCSGNALELIRFMIFSPCG